MLDQTQSVQMITITLKSSLMNWSQLEREFKTALKQAPGMIALNCEDLRQVTSTQLGVIWQAHCLGTDAGIRVQLVSVPQTLKRALKALDLYDKLEIEDTDVETSQAIQFAEIAVTGEDNYNNEFPATKEAARTSLTSFIEFLKNSGLPEIMAFDLRTIYYEVIHNILEYGKIPSDKTITFSLNLTTSNITLCFTDSGVSFDPTKRKAEFDPKLAASMRQLKGIGLTLVHRLADSMEYTRENNSLNVLTIKKSWSK